MNDRAASMPPVAAAGGASAVANGRLPDGPPGWWVGLLDALQAGPAPEQRLARIDQARREQLGPGLLTLSAYAPEKETLRRLWSSNPAAYPVGGSKRKTGTAWTHQVLLRCEVFVAEGDAAIEAAFDDHARIAALGLHSALNVPLAVGSRCIGTFNVLRPGTAWPVEDQVVARLLAALAMPALWQPGGE